MSRCKHIPFVSAVAAAATAIVCLGGVGPAVAQAPTPAPRPPASEPLAADGPYAGATRKAFYAPADRIAELRMALEQGVVPGPAGRRALAQLKAIGQELKFRIARHNGDLLDWDRELINQRLDALIKQYPALRG